MKKAIQPLSVRTQGGEILIEQDLGADDDSQSILIEPEQVPILIEWLQEAVKELNAEQAEDQEG